MVESKKKRTKLKNAIKQKTKVKQIAKQSTNINIKIGEIKKKKKRKKAVKRGGGGQPGRLTRRPHLPTNPMIGSVFFTPPPGYMTPHDIRGALPPPPPAAPVAAAPVVAPLAPVAPLPVGHAIGLAHVGAPVAAAPLGAAAMAAAPPDADVAPLRQPAPPVHRDRPRVQFDPRHMGGGGFQPVHPPALSRQSSQSRGDDPRSPQGSFAGSYGTSAGGASPRRVLRNPVAGNVMPSEAQIAQQQQVAVRSRGDSRVATGAVYRYGSPLASPDLYGSGSQGSGSSGSAQEDEAKSGGVADTFKQMYSGRNDGALALNRPQNRLRQGMRGILTGGSTGPGGGGGLMAPGGTTMGNQGSHPQPSYVNTYANTAVNRSKGRVGQPHKRPGAGGARAGAGRRSRQVAPLLEPGLDAPFSPAVSGAPMEAGDAQPIAEAARPKPRRRKKGLRIRLAQDPPSVERLADGHYRVPLRHRDPSPTPSMASRLGKRIRGVLGGGKKGKI